MSGISANEDKYVMEVVARVSSYSENERLGNALLPSCACSVSQGFNLSHLNEGVVSRRQKSLPPLQYLNLNKSGEGGAIANPLLRP